MPFPENNHLSDTVCTLDGKTAAVRVQKTARKKGRAASGWLAHGKWTYASVETLRNVIAAVRCKGNARLGLKITEQQGKNTGHRIISVGPIPRFAQIKTDVYSDIRTTHLTQYGLDLIEDDDVASAIRVRCNTFISTRWPASGKDTRLYPKGHRKVKNHAQLLEDLLEHDELCVCQFAAGLNIDVIHLVTVYNALLTAVAMWDRDGPAVVVAEMDVGGQLVVNGDTIEAEMVERRRVNFIRIWTEIRGAGYKFRAQLSKPTAQEKSM
jgi:hypothetical protein